MFTINIKPGYGSALRKQKDSSVDLTYRFDACVQVSEKEEIRDEMVIQVDREMSLEEAQDLYFECRTDYLDAIATDYSSTWQLKTFECIVEEKTSRWLPSRLARQAK